MIATRSHFRIQRLSTASFLPLVLISSWILLVSWWTLECNIHTCSTPSVLPLGSCTTTRTAQVCISPRCPPCTVCNSHSDQCCARKDNPLQWSTLQRCRQVPLHWMRRSQHCCCHSPLTDCERRRVSTAQFVASPPVHMPPCRTT